MASVANGRIGKLWGRGHETFSSSIRRILSVKGPSATTYLQGLVTSDLSKDAPRSLVETPYHHGETHDNEEQQQRDRVVYNPNLYATCFLQNKGRVVTDALLWKLGKEENDEYLLDVPADTADALLDHLHQFKLRRTKVEITDVSDRVTSHVIYGTLYSQDNHEPPEGCLGVGLDPRHASMGLRVLSSNNNNNNNSSSSSSFVSRLREEDFPSVPGTQNVLRKLTGIAEGMEVAGKTALETNQEWLTAVSFDKGCYLGQELTARSHHTGRIRKRIMPIVLTDTQTAIPRPWILAQQTQEQQQQQQQQKRDTEQKGDDDKENLALHQPLLPQLSAAAVGGLWTLLQQQEEQQFFQVNNNNDNSSGVQELVQRVHESVKPGDSIVENGKTIGRIVSTPADGTSLVLAQMRLDSVGLMPQQQQTTTWSKTNRVTLGEQDKSSSETREFRYLPILPVWWPSHLDPASGKAMEAEDPLEETTI